MAIRTGRVPGKFLAVPVLCSSLALCASALEITGTVPAGIKGALKGDFTLSGLAVKNISYEKGAVILPVTESNGKTYSDVKLLSKALYGKLEVCFKSGCAPSSAAKVKAPLIKVEEFRPLKSKTRVANAEVSFDGELLAVVGVMASSQEPGTFWLAWPAALEFKDRTLKNAVEAAVKSAWAGNNKRSENLKAGKADAAK